MQVLPGMWTHSERLITIGAELNNRGSVSAGFLLKMGSKLQTVLTCRSANILSNIATSVTRQQVKLRTFCHVADIKLDFLLKPLTVSSKWVEQGLNIICNNKQQFLILDDTCHNGVNSAYPCTGQHSIDQLGDHGEVDGHPVSFFYTWGQE